jgi:hypothetical protein
MRSEIVLLKRVFSWIWRVTILLVVLAGLARYAQLPFNQTLVVCALVILAAVIVLSVLTTLLHRWKLISQSPWDEAPGSAGLSDFGFSEPLPPITEPAPMATTSKRDSAAPPAAPGGMPRIGQ